MSKTFDVRIRADKSGPEPAPGQPWPLLGVEISDPPDEIGIPTSWVQRFKDAPWLTVEGPSWVERPSRPDPDTDDTGSTTVAAAHRNPADGPPPHAFMHVERLVIDTLNHGRVVYRVDAQPDKYVDSDDPTEQVTPEVYADGRTRVDAFYRCTRQEA